MITIAPGQSIDVIVSCGDRITARSNGVVIAFPTTWQWQPLVKRVARVVMPDEGDHCMLGNAGEVPATIHITRMGAAYADLLRINR